MIMIERLNTGRIVSIEKGEFDCSERGIGSSTLNFVKMSILVSIDEKTNPSPLAWVSSLPVF